MDRGRWWLWESARQRLGAQRDVIKVADAHDKYNEKLQTRQADWLYWLRGIYWESNKNSPAARRDYEAAIELASQQPLPPIWLADTYMRLARLMAAGDCASCEPWDEQFATAAALSPQRPQIWYEWGVAWSAHYESLAQCAAPQSDDKATETCPPSGVTLVAPFGDAPPACKAPSCLDCPKPANENCAYHIALQNFGAASKLNVSFTSPYLATAQLYLTAAKANMHKLDPPDSPSVLCENPSVNLTWPSLTSSPTCAPPDDSCTLLRCA